MRFHARLHTDRRRTPLALALLAVLLTTATRPTEAADPPKANPARTLTLVRTNNWLIIRGPHLPGEIKINYLEAYCRAGSTEADWVKHTMVSHTCRFVSLSADAKTLRLADTLADGVTVQHVITVALK